MAARTQWVDVELERLAMLMEWAVMIVGAASLIFQGIALVAGVTETTRDDEVVTKVQATLVKIQKVLNKVALNKPLVRAKPP